MGLRQFCQWLLVVFLVLHMGLSLSAASVRFDNAADLLSRTTSMPAFGDLTHMAWIYRAVDQAADEAFFYLADSSSLGAYLGMVCSGTEQKLQHDTSGLGVGDQDGVGTILSLNTWYHVAGVFDNTANTWTIYLNGVLDNSISGLTGTTTWGFEVLGNLSSGGSNRLDGRFAAYKQFTAVLTAAEIKAEMAYFVPVRRTSLHSYSPLRTSTETTSYGGGANWTASGTLTTEADPPLTGGVSPGNAFLGF